MSTQTDFAREQMVKQQVRAGDVLNERVLATLQRVPRERFVPAAWRELAFADASVPLPAGQRMLPPLLVGQILQALELRGGDRVLEVGTGSGFLSACIAQLAASVHSLELHAELVALARSNLAATATRGVEVQHIDAYEFVPATGGYDAIVLTGSLPVPDSRFEQWLAPGGRLFAVVGHGSPMQAQLTRRRGPDDTQPGEWQLEVLFETQLPMLEHARQPPAFEF